ncbi:MAG: helix-turn-helix domain-containing protein [Thermoanaerobaculia bacterium]
MKLRQARNPDYMWKVFLTLFNEGRPLTVTELGRLSNLPRQTVYHQLKLLSEMSLVVHDGKQWLCQPLFIDEKKMDEIVAPLYRVLLHVIIEKMLIQKGASPQKALKGMLLALAHLFEVDGDQLA